MYYFLKRFICFLLSVDHSATYFSAFCWIKKTGVHLSSLFWPGLTQHFLHWNIWDKKNIFFLFFSFYSHFLSRHPDMKEPCFVICIFTPECIFQVGIEILWAASNPSAAVSWSVSVPLFIFNLPWLCFFSHKHRSSFSHPVAFFHLSFH